jgi:hypothetical protein
MISPFAAMAAGGVRPQFFHAAITDNNAALRFLNPRERKNAMAKQKLDLIKAVLGFTGVADADLENTYWLVYAAPSTICCT